MRRILSLAFFALLTERADPQTLEPFSFAVASDTHVGTAEGAKNLERLAEEANRLRVAFTIVCGDLTERGLPEEWSAFTAAAKKFAAPLHPVLGNHDSRWAAEGKRPLAKFLGIDRPYLSFDHGGVHFVLLDSSIVGEAHGGIDRTQLEWLDADLAALPKSSSAVVALHHPPGSEKEFLAGDLPYVLWRNGVGLLLAGHGHSMRRWSLYDVPYRMTSNLYAQKGARWRRIRVEPSLSRFVVENRTLGSDAVEEEEPIPFRGGKNATVDKGLEYPAGMRSKEWRVETAASSLRAFGASGDRLYVAGTEGVLAVHEVPTGALVKTFPLDAPSYASPLVAGDRVIVATEAGTVAALRASDLKTLWEVRLDGAVTMTPAADEHRLYVGSGDGVLHALALADGREAWAQEGERHFGPPAAGNDRVFAGNWDGHLYAFAAADGKILWKHRFPGSFYFAPGTSRPAVAGDLVVATSAPVTKPADAPSVFALRAGTGEVVWSARYAAGYCSPLAFGDAVILATASGKVVSLELATGKVRWERDLGEECYDSSPVACRVGIAIATLRGEVFFLDASTGTEKRRERATGFWQFATPVVHGERLFLPDAFDRSIRSVLIP